MDTTDSEDSLHPVVQHGPQTTRSRTRPPGLAVVGGLSPMIIMNNVLLKQVTWGTDTIQNNFNYLLVSIHSTKLKNMLP